MDSYRGERRATGQEAGREKRTRACRLRSGSSGLGVRRGEDAESEPEYGPRGWLANRLEVTLAADPGGYGSGSTR